MINLLIIILISMCFKISYFGFFILGPCGTWGSLLGSGWGSGSNSGSGSSMTGGIGRSVILFFLYGSTFWSCLNTSFYYTCARSSQYHILGLNLLILLTWHIRCFIDYINPCCCVQDYFICTCLIFTFLLTYIMYMSLIKIISNQTGMHRVLMDTNSFNQPSIFTFRKTGEHLNLKIICTMHCGMILL